MTTLTTSLTDRHDEFNAHLALARAMELHVLDGGCLGAGELSLTVRHLQTIKSGLIVHLYNIVEALMSRAMDEVAAAVLIEPPESWTENTLREWVRSNASIGLDGSETSRLELVHNAAMKLLKLQPIERITFKKPSGTWSDRLIYRFSQRLDINLEMPNEIHISIQRSPKYGDKSPMEFLADRRNSIAHGRKTFEDGASDLSLPDIEELAKVTIDYMKHALIGFQSFIDERRYVSAQ